VCDWRELGGQTEGFTSWTTFLGLGRIDSSMRLYRSGVLCKGAGQSNNKSHEHNEYSGAAQPAVLLCAIVVWVALTVSCICAVVQDGKVEKKHCSKKILRGELMTRDKILMCCVHWSDVLSSALLTHICTCRCVTAEKKEKQGRREGCADVR